MTEPRHLLIVGASARAAAQSAQRAGFAVTAIDLFADEDLAACANAILCDDYPSALPRLAERAPDGPWMYTGGLENHPRIVAEIAVRRRLWGNHSGVLRRVRDPLAVQAALAKAGLPALDVTLDPSSLPRDGSWLAKPLLGSGGKHIHPLGEKPAALGALPDQKNRGRSRWYFQRRQIGLPASAIYVGHSGCGILFGITEQLVGESWCVGSPFQYAGSIFPLVHDGLMEDERFNEQLRSLGDVLAAEFHLVGLFGVDGVIHGSQFWPVEVNPRYTASCEVVEQLTGMNFVSLHAAACDENNSFGPLAERSPGGVGKLIVFARADGQFTDRAAIWVRQTNSSNARCHVADVPRVGTTFSAGDPVVTLLAHGDRPAELRERLASLASELRDQLG